MSLFPAFLKLEKRRVLVVGGGSIAVSKMPGLLQAGAEVAVVAPSARPEIQEWARAGRLRWSARAFKASDLRGKFLVIAATALPEVNSAVFEEAEKQQVLCNAVDDIEHCHFYYGAVMQRGDLQIAISTNGKSPALAQRLRKELEEQFGAEYARWLDELGAAREELRAKSTDAERKKRELHELASEESFSRFVDKRGSREGIGTAANRAGKVFLIGAGPGDPELLTRKATRLLESADVVLHDSLVSAEILALIPARAQRIDVGKRAGFRLLTQQDINALLIDAAMKHKTVVRLKGGDPLLFGRAAEEIGALRDGHIAFEIVPGISAAFAAAAEAQVSLTDRRLASHVLVTTFARAAETQVLPILGITSQTTVVVYMPGPDYSEVSRWLQESGIVAETPCLVVSKATQREQAVRFSTLAQLAELATLAAPALLIVGRVVAHGAAGMTALDLLRQLAPEKLAPQRWKEVAIPEGETQ